VRKHLVRIPRCFLRLHLLDRIGEAFQVAQKIRVG
jgi:hypothetical protein